MTWDKSSTWVGVEENIMDAVRACLPELEESSIAWDGMAESGVYRKDPIIDIWVNSLTELGSGEVSHAYDPGTDAMVPTVETTNRFTLSVRVTGDEAGVSTMQLLTQLRRRMRRDLAIRKALAAVGISLELIQPSFSGPDLTNESRTYTVLVVDFQFLYLEREVWVGAGDRGWFNRVQMTLTETDTGDIVSMTAGPPPDPGATVVTPGIIVNPLAIPLPLGNSRVYVRGYSFTDTNSVVMREAEFLCTRTVSHVHATEVSGTSTEAGETPTGLTWGVAPTTTATTLVLTGSPASGAPWGEWTWQYEAVPLT